MCVSTCQQSLIITHFQEMEISPLKRSAYCVSTITEIRMALMMKSLPFVKELSHFHSFDLHITQPNH